MDLVLAAGSICQQLPAMAGRFITSLTLSRVSVSARSGSRSGRQDLGRIVALIPVLQRVKCIHLKNLHSNQIITGCEIQATGHRGLPQALRLA